MRLIRTLKPSPRPDATGRDPNERTVFEIVIGVLIVLLPEGYDSRRVRFLAWITARSCPANLHPSELGPVVCVVINE